MVDTHAAAGTGADAVSNGVFNTLLGAFSGRLGTLVQRHPRAAGFQKWLLGSVLAALAVRIFLTERPLGPTA